MTILFPNLLLSGHLFDIEINITLSTNNQQLSPKNYNLISLGPFNYGFNETKDTIFYPENVMLQFTVAAADVPRIITSSQSSSAENSQEAYKQEYFNLIHQLTFSPTIVTIRRDNAIFFLGSIDPKSITSDYSNFSIKCTVLSDFAKLKKTDPRSNSLVLPLNTDTKILFSDLILHIVRSVLPHVTQIIPYSEVRVSTNFTFLGQPVTAGFPMLGTFLFDYLGNPWNHPDYIAVLKDILATFGLVMFIYDNAVILQPRWYFPSDPYIIEDNKLISGPDATSQNALALKGLHVRLIHNNYTFNQSYNLGTVTLDGNGNVQNSEEVETLHLSQPGGTPPGMPNNSLNNRNLWVLIPEYISGLNNAQWVPSRPNECFLSSNFGTKAPLWQILGDRLFQLISKKRLSFKLELLGTEYLYNPFFRHPSYPNSIFRARTASIDFSKGTTTLELLSC